MAEEKKEKQNNAEQTESRKNNRGGEATAQQEKETSTKERKKGQQTEAKPEKNNRGGEATVQPEERASTKDGKKEPETEEDIVEMYRTFYETDVEWSKSWCERMIQEMEDSIKKSRENITHYEGLRDNASTDKEKNDCNEKIEKERDKLKKRRKRLIIYKSALHNKLEEIKNKISNYISNHPEYEKTIRLEMARTFDKNIEDQETKLEKLKKDEQSISTLGTLLEKGIDPTLEQEILDLAKDEAIRHYQADTERIDNVIKKLENDIESINEQEKKYDENIAKLNGDIKGIELDIELFESLEKEGHLSDDGKVRLQSKKNEIEKYKSKLKELENGKSEFDKNNRKKISDYNKKINKLKENKTKLENKIKQCQGNNKTEKLSDEKIKKKKKNIIEEAKKLGLTVTEDDINIWVNYLSRHMMESISFKGQSGMRWVKSISKAFEGTNIDIKRQIRRTERVIKRNKDAFEEAKLGELGTEFTPQSKAIKECMGRVKVEEKQEEAQPTANVSPTAVEPKTAPTGIAPTPKTTVEGAAANSSKPVEETQEIIFNYRDEDLINCAREYKKLTALTNVAQSDVKWWQFFKKMRQLSAKFRVSRMFGRGKKQAIETRFKRRLEELNIDVDNLSKEDLSNFASKVISGEEIIIPVAPAQTTPAQTAPAQTAPAQTSPAQTSPAQTVPAQTSPAQTAPAQTTPVQTAPVQTAPVQTASEKKSSPLFSQDPALEKLLMETIISNLEKKSGEAKSKGKDEGKEKSR